MNEPRQHIKRQRHCFASKGPSSQGYGFSNSHVWMWELDHKESWARRNWCFWIMVLEKTLENPLDCKAIKPVIPKGNQSWILIGKTDAEAETPILWTPLRTDSFENPLMLGKIEGGRKRGNRGWDGWMASTFFSGSKHLFISWLQLLSAVILETPKRKSVTVSTVSPSICHEVVGPDAMILVFWMLFYASFFTLLFSLSRGSSVPLCFLP